MTIRWDTPPTTWTWTSPSERAKRDAHIRELYAMGISKKEIAEQYDLTVQRVHQIIGKG